MVNNTDLSVEEMLTALKTQAIYGRTHLFIAKGLITAKSNTEAFAPTFFRLTLDAHLQTAQMYAAKLYDKRSKSLKVGSLVEKAFVSEASFPFATPQEVRDTVVGARLLMSNLEPILEAVQIRRNECLAHLDPRTVADLGSLYARSALTVEDLDHILVETTNILNLFSQMFDRTVSVPTLPGGDDYGGILKLAAETLAAASK